MSEYYFVNQKGLIEKKEYDQSLCISYDKAVEIFQNVFNSLGINYSFSKVSGMSTCCEFNTEEPFFKHFYASIYQITPGGRSMVSGTLDAEKEFRIQIHAKEYNFIYEKKINKEKSCQIGVYDFYGTQMIVAWNPKQSSAAAETPISTQVGIDEIAQAVKYGFHQYKNKSGTYVCVFKKELIPFYLKNSEWLHDELVKSLPNHFVFSEPYTVNFIEKPKRKVLFNDYFKEDFNFRYIKSLLAKPFVILTGNSGTGKTLISLDLAKYLALPCAVPAVDETSFGRHYENPVREPLLQPLHLGGTGELSERIGAEDILAATSLARCLWIEDLPCEPGRACGQLQCVIARVLWKVTTHP